MIDLHCHILPGIDDGPRTLETSLAMLKMAEEDGITHVAATPHYRCGEQPDTAAIRTALESFQQEALKRGIRTAVVMGADIRLTYELMSAVMSRSIPTINGSRYFLLELPDLIPPHIDSFIFEAEIQGLVPIITHPERNYSLLATPEKAFALHEAGALFQLTAMSTTGEFGRQIRKFSYALLNQGAADFVATDAHSTGRRRPVLSTAYQEVAREFGEEYSRRLFLENPLAVIEDREILR